MDAPVLLAFNRGLMSTSALSRTDLERTRLSAEQQTNWMPRTMGNMMLRPGMGYIGATLDNNASVSIPFVYKTSDTAKIEVTDGKIRVWIDDALVSRASVTAAVTNGAFGSDVASWTDSDEGAAASAWVTGGYLGLTGTGTAAAIRDQEITVNEASTRHALDIVIQRGPVVLRVGSTSGGDDYIEETTLETGTHSLAFTPTGNFHIRLQSRLARQVLVDSIAVASAGTMELDAPWAEEDLSLLRWDQSRDVVFLACDGYQQRRIERRATDSWSVVLYLASDGPFRIVNTGPITLTPSGITGNITLTASAALFRSGHVGGIFQITSTGQRVEVSAGAQNTFSDDIRVTGVGESRRFTINITGTWSATVVLQRSIGETGNWEDVSGQSYTGNTATTYADGLSNQIVFYRIGIKTGGYTSGTAEAFLDYPLGAIIGTARVTAVATSVSASAEVLVDLGGTEATDDWAEGSWSDYRGWPTGVAFFEGRLWWAGRGNFWGSVSDAFSSFDPETEGDSGPINRSIGAGSAEIISWLLPLQRLVAGSDMSEIVVKSSSLDEPLTPTNFNLRDPSTQGSANVAALKIDDAGIFVQRAGKKLYELKVSQDTFNFESIDLTALVPEVGDPSITQIAVQRQPDTRIHAVRSDGTVAILVYDRAENVRCWIEVVTDGLIEDVCVLPGTGEDRVYYTVARTVGGSTVRYHEKWALESECVGGTLSKQADSFILYSGAATSTITGLDHLEGEDVVVWTDGICLADADGDIATFTVDSGSITLTNRGEAYEASEAVIGLPYRARFKSAKLAYAAQVGSALAQNKRVTSSGPLLGPTHHLGLKIGPDFDTMDDLPQVYQHGDVALDTVFTNYDDGSVGFPAEWSPDTRICLEANAPRPATVRAFAFVIETHSKV